MKLGKVKLAFVIALLALFASEAFHAQEHGAGQHSKMDMSKMTDASGAPEIFCSHRATGQLCPGNAQMFKLSGAQKERYEEALDNYNKAVAAAQKQFVADVKDKAGLSPAEVALTETWFAVGLNPEINKILATKSESTKTK